MSHNESPKAMSPGKIKPSDVSQSSTHGTDTRPASPSSRKPSFVGGDRVSSPSSAFRNRSGRLDSTTSSNNNLGRSSPRGSFVQRGSFASQPRGSFVQRGSFMTNSLSLPSPKSARRQPNHLTTTIAGRAFQITRAQVTHAFGLIQENNAPLKQKDLRKRLDTLFPHFGSKEFKSMVPDGAAVTADAVWACLVESLECVSLEDPYANMDPVAELLGHLSAPGVDGQRVVDRGLLQKAMRDFSGTDVTPEQVHSIITVSDRDGDGELGESDLRERLGCSPGGMSLPTNTTILPCESDGED